LFHFCTVILAKENVEELEPTTGVVVGIEIYLLGSRSFIVLILLKVWWMVDVGIGYSGRLFSALI
jgi:hypothetical protein